MEVKVITDDTSFVFTMPEGQAEILTQMLNDPVQGFFLCMAGPNIGHTAIRTNTIKYITIRKPDQ